MESREGTPAPTTLKTQDRMKEENNNDTTTTPDLSKTDTKATDESSNTLGAGGENPLDADDIIDMSTFDQLLDMDDEDDHEFSYSLVENYFDQADTTFKDMDKALEKKDLLELSRLGHFLKGSSAAIGLKKVKATCEKIQNLGNTKKAENPLEDITEEEALKDIAPLLPQVKLEYSEAEEWLKNFYKDDREA